jgi:hypothetical protein
LYWGYLVTFTKVLTIYHSWIHLLHHSPFLETIPIPGIVSIGLIFFIFIHEYIIFSLYLPSYTLPLYPLPSHWYQLSERTCFTFMFSIFQKRHFCLFKIVIWGVSLWHFHVYMYYNPNWFIPCISKTWLFFQVRLVFKMYFQA